MSTLKVEEVSQLFRSTSRGGGLTAALRKVSFDIAQGEVVTLIGESGSGKSTLGRVILRLLKPTSGKVTFGGTRTSPRTGNAACATTTGRYRASSRIRSAPTTPSTRPTGFSRSSGARTSLIWRAHSGMPSWRALAAVSLNPGDVLGKYPHQLSGGQQQRILIARALLLDIRLLVADEIISMLDASTRVDILNLLVTLKRSGLAILFITHDLSLGNYVSDRTIILRHGAIVEMGATPKVFGNPQHEYTRMLLTAVPELHRKWERAGLAGAVAEAPAANEAAARGSAIATLLEPPSLAEVEADHLVAVPG
jgi:ABC-type oligopeptide transport system ATPase subunit